MKITWFRLALLTLLAISIAICGDAPKPLFPQIKGWKCTIEEKKYTADNLWDIIDGAAESYLAYGFEEMQLAEYSKPGMEPIRVDIYRHSSLTNAYGIYSQERGSKAKLIGIGAQGYTEEGALNFFTGHYYVRISTNGKGKNVPAGLKLIASKVLANLEQENRMPEELALFPSEGKKPNSDTYINQSFLGYAFLTNAFVVEYTKPEKLKMFLIRCSTPAKADSMIGEYFASIKHLETVKKGRFTVADPHHGNVILVLYSGFAFGVWNYTDSANALVRLEQLEKNIQKVAP